MSIPQLDMENWSSLAAQAFEFQEGMTVWRSRTPSDFSRFKQASGPHIFGREHGQDLQ